MTEQAITNKRIRLPLWSHALMVAVVVALIATFGVAVGTVVYLKQVGNDAFNPAQMHIALTQIMQFPNELPAGYKQQMGLSTLGYVFCGISHADSNQQLALLSGSIAVDKSRSALDIARDAYDHFGVNTASISARFYFLLNQGEEDVLGEKMAYIIGKAKDAEGVEYEGLVGCIVPKNVQKVILVYAVQPKGKPLDKNVALNLLRSAKGF